MDAECGQPPRGSKHDRILEAAAGIFLDRDYSRVTIEEIAEAAGVGKGTIYEYFRSKEELFMECVTSAVEKYIMIFDEYYQASRSCRENLRRFLDVQLRFLKENSRWVRLLFNERPLQVQGLEEWLLERRQRVLQAIEGIIALGIREGEVRPDLNTVLAARAFNSLYNVLGGMLILDGLEITEQDAADLFAIFWKGVRAGVD